MTIKQTLEAAGVSQRLYAKYKVAFGTPEGKDVLLDLQKRFHIHDDCFVPGQPDTSLHNEGQRSVVLHIITLLALDKHYIPEDFNDVLNNRR